MTSRSSLTHWWWSKTSTAKDAGASDKNVPTSSNPGAQGRAYIDISYYTKNDPQVKPDMMVGSEARS